MHLALFFPDWFDGFVRSGFGLGSQRNASTMSALVDPRLCRNLVSSEALMAAKSAIHSCPKVAVCFGSPVFLSVLIPALLSLRDVMSSAEFLNLFVVEVFASEIRGRHQMVNVSS